MLEQEWGESLLLMCAGMAKVSFYTADGDEVVLSMLGEGDVFGEMAALDGSASSADVVALTPVTVLKLRSRSTVEEFDGGLRFPDLQPLIKRGLLPAEAAHSCR